MRFRSFISLAAALLPLTGSAEEKPLWEIQVRLGTGKALGLDAGITQLFTGENAAAVGPETVIRLAGLRNEATPEADWVAEVRGLKDLGQVIKRIETEAQPDGHGRFLLEEQGVRFVVWSDGNAVLRLASPPENAAVTVAPTASFTDAAWLVGWIDLRQLNDGVLESELLKLPDSLSFSVSGAGDRVQLQVSADLKSAQAAETTRLLMEEIRTELDDDDPSQSAASAWKVFTHNTRLTVDLELPEGQLDALFAEVTKAVEAK